jgi:hypothetical protein
MYNIHRLNFTIGMLCSCQYESFLPTFRQIKHNNILKICDSGAFSKHGHNYNSYDKLLPMYESLNINYGVMLDIRHDKVKTIQNAKDGIKKYKEKNYSFELLAVCQGKSLWYDTSDWLECYKEMYSMGYDYFAIGGTIEKNNTEYYRINEYLTKKIISDIRDIDKNARLFALGFLSPKRLNYMLENNIDGDSKSWIFDFNTYGTGTREYKDMERIWNLHYKYIKPMNDFYENTN